MTRVSVLVGRCALLAAFAAAASASAASGSTEFSAWVAATGVRKGSVHTPIVLSAKAAPQPAENAAVKIDVAAGPAPGSMETTNERALSGIDKLLTYFEEVQKLTSPERLQEYELLKRTWNHDRSEYVRLQLAMLLSVPDSTFHDGERAQSLIDPILKEKSPRSRLRPIAYVISILLAAQHEAEEEMRVLKDALLDEAERNRALEQKLEALKTLEKNLIERESGNSLKTR